MKKGIPSHDTIARVFIAIDSKNFQSCFIHWVSSICGALVGQVVAIDGKTMRGSHRRRSGKKAIHLVSAFASSQGICLGQVKTEEKSNEITAIPELINSKVQLAKRRARGYRNLGNFINMIYFLCGKMKFNYPLYST